MWGWETDTVGDTDEFRYTTVRNPSGEGEVAGVMDSSALPARRPVPPTGRSTGRSTTSPPPWPRSTALGGSVESDAQETPYGILAAVADPAGARFSLRKAPA